MTVQATGYRQLGNSGTRYLARMTRDRSRQHAVFGQLACHDKDGLFTGDSSVRLRHATKEYCRCPACKARFQPLDKSPA